MTESKSSLNITDVADGESAFSVRANDTEPPIGRPDVSLLVKGFESAYTVETWWNGRYQNAIDFPFEDELTTPLVPLEHAPETVAMEESTLVITDTSPVGVDFEAKRATIRIEPHDEGYTASVIVENDAGVQRNTEHVVPLYNPNHPGQYERYYELYDWQSNEGTEY